MPPPLGRLFSGAAHSEKNLCFCTLQAVVLFVDEPSSKLFCILCQRVFKDPVITSCGVRLLSGTNVKYSNDSLIIN